MAHRGSIGSRRHRRQRLISDINVVPYIDVMLVLLIIFMVTAKLIANEGVPLDLPKAATAGAVQSIFTVSIDNQGSVRVNGRAVAGRAGLGEEARRALAVDPELRTLISASKQANHGTVMQVVDSLRAVGVSKIAFAVDKSLPPATFEAQNDRE